MADNEQKPDEVVSGTEDTEAGTADGASSGATGDRGRPRLLVSGDRLGRYQLEEELGEGGMATVFRAIDVELRREVAIKVLFAHLAKRREIAQRFQREARAVAALDHPHILHVYDVGGGEDGEPPYLVLELVKGESLDEFASDRNIPAEVVAAIGVVLCDALECAHAAGIIHRDIKPANVLIADDGRLVLADFGVAHAEGDSLVTRTGAMLGTPAFMAPEQALGSDLTARSDLYSVGATLYRLATGSLPYTGSTAKIVSSILTGERESPQRVRPSVGPDFSAIVDKLMATDPDERYPDAKKVRVALGELVETVADDPEELVRRYFADPEQVSEELEAAALRWSLAEGQRAAAAGRSPRALALANRALELDPDNHEALALVERASSEPRRWGMWVVLALLVAAGAAVGVYLLNEKPSTVAAAVADAAPARDALALASAVVDADVADAQADDSSA
ncbi:MAG: serine/threonine protein kinase, partial [Deltaproteobacteria bacterium]|nr:serine/threonine protein kinase [Deltaproteobacteria bacterium]